MVALLGPFIGQRVVLISCSLIVMSMVKPKSTSKVAVSEVCYTEIS